MCKIDALLAAILACGVIAVGPSLTRAAAPASQPTAADSAAAEAKYTQTIDKRAADAVAVLGIDDPAKSARVHDVIVAQYRGLRDWHDAHDAEVKDLLKKSNAKDATQADAAKTQLTAVRSSLKALHDQYLAKLSTDLTPEQVEQVKDKMTYGTVAFTMRGYEGQYPDLTDEEKSRIVELLKDAREDAMDCGSQEEKVAVFKRAKGKINNYLSQQGHSASKKAAKTTQPAEAPAK